MEQKLTEELLHEIKCASCIEDYLQENRTELASGKLHEYMNTLLVQKALKKADVAKGSNLNRAYVYQIFSGDKLPSRDKVLALAFGFQLDLMGFQRFLKQAGHRELYARDKRDAVILFALNSGYDLMKTNELLFGLTEQVIE